MPPLGRCRRELKAFEGRFLGEVGTLSYRTDNLVRAAAKRRRGNVGRTFALRERQRLFVVSGIGAVGAFLQLLAIEDGYAAASSTYQACALQRLQCDRDTGTVGPEH